MDSLPFEILFQIFEFLSENDLVSLQTVSKRMLVAARENKLWRAYCYDKSPAVRTKEWTSFVQAATQSRIGTTASEAASTFAAMLQVVDARSGRNGGRLPTPRPFESSGSVTRRTQEILNWDPSYESEDVDWYSEYIARNAPISVSWFAKSNPDEELSCLASCETPSTRKAVGATEDGTVCVWDIDRAVTHRSSTGALFSKRSNPYDSFVGATECISVDARENKAFIAIGSCLTTFDLETLELVSIHDFTYPITAISESSVGLDAPLVVGTKASIHIHDGRVGSTTPKPLPKLDGAIPKVSIAGDMCPLSILNVSPNSIYLAGRHPSIVRFDRRTIPQVEDSIHSGARLCSLALSTSVTTSPSSASWSSLNPKILACGEYNGRGSLEVYSLANDNFDPAEPTSKVLPPSQIYQNRQTASRAKLLSVASHGTRAVFSDTDGMLKWAERDGHSLVRSWNINKFKRPHSTNDHEQRTPVHWREESLGSDYVKKIIPLNGGASGRGARGDGQILLWTNEKAGLLQFKDREEWFDTYEKSEDALKSESDADVESRQTAEQRRLHEAMTRALLRQTDEINWMRRFGLA